MADSITTAATFTTTNMKPAAAGGETIDSVWGRNAADNTGYLFYRRMPGPSVCLTSYGTAAFSSGGTVQGTGVFFKYPEHGTISGSFCGYYESSNTENGSLQITVDGTSVIATGLTHSGAGIHFAGSFAKSISHLAASTDFNLVARFMATSAVGTKFHSVNITSWLNF